MECQQTAPPSCKRAVTSLRPAKFKIGTTFLFLIIFSHIMTRELPDVHAEHQHAHQKNAFLPLRATTTIKIFTNRDSMTGQQGQNNHLLEISLIFFFISHWQNDHTNTIISKGLHSLLSTVANQLPQSMQKDCSKQAIIAWLATSGT